MGAAVAEFFMIIGPEVTPPTNMVELIPYLLTVLVSVILVVCCFRVFTAIASAIANWRHF